MAVIKKIEATQTTRATQIVLNIDPDPIKSRVTIYYVQETAIGGKVTSEALPVVEKTVEDAMAINPRIFPDIVGLADDWNPAKT